MNDVYISPAFELYHFGIKGMKWGLRRYQNEDGSLTPEGRRHYGYGDGGQKYFNKDGSFSERGLKRYESSASKKDRKRYGNNIAYKTSLEYDNKIAKQKAKTASLLLGAAAGKTYKMSRALGESRTKATLRAIFDLNIGTAAGLLTNTMGRGAAAQLVLAKTGSRSAASFIASASGFLGRQVVETALAASGKTLSIQQQLLRSKNYKLKSEEQRARYRKK